MSVLTDKINWGMDGAVEGLVASLSHLSEPGCMAPSPQRRQESATTTASVSRWMHPITLHHLQPRLVPLAQVSLGLKECVPYLAPGTNQTM